MHSKILVITGTIVTILLCIALVVYGQVLWQKYSGLYEPATPEVQNNTQAVTVEENEESLSAQEREDIFQRLQNATSTEMKDEERTEIYTELTKDNPSTISEERRQTIIEALQANN